MEKSCFIIMPISDVDPYPAGHFRRVYEHLIKPAVELAGFVPIRADDILTTNYIAIDVLKRIINSEMALCDLSSRNPNVLYELGIRQAFNLPVTFIKDSITSRIFDIQGLRDIEYDHNLRIDNVEKTVEVIRETIGNTFKSKDSDEVNSLVSLLGIHAAKISSTTEISEDTQVILNNIQSLASRLLDIEKKLPVGGSAPVTGDFYSEIPVVNSESFEVGDLVRHSRFGVGRITKLEGSLANRIATINFTSNGEKKIMLNFVTLNKIYLNTTNG